jgi:hypothetical protein
MAQRWMQAKMQLAKSHGITRSGANRPMGKVVEDRPIGPAPERNLPPQKLRDMERVTEAGRVVIYEVTRKTRDRKGMIAVLKAPQDRPVVWGKGRKARRAAARAWSETIQPCEVTPMANANIPNLFGTIVTLDGFRYLLTPEGRFIPLPRQKGWSAHSPAPRAQP